MKNITKNLLLVIFFSAALLALTSCGKNVTEVSTTETGNNGATVEDKSSDVEVPDAAMQSVLTAADGSTSRLQDYKGKVVLVNFWATWCPPCREEMPGLMKVQSEFKDKGFEIIGVDADDEDLDLIKNFGAKMNINYKLVKADKDFFKSFLDITKAGAIPQSFLINRDGKITAGWVGGGAKNVAEIRSGVAKLVAN